MLGLLIYKVIFFMENLIQQIEKDLKNNKLKLHSEPFFAFFNDETNIIRDPHICHAVLFFNKALQILDIEPEEEEREEHVLTGDYFFSQFYKILAAHNEYKVINDVSGISKEITSKKSAYAEIPKSPSTEELQHLLFAPLIYLVDNGYAQDSLLKLISRYIEEIDIKKLPYITKSTGDDNG
ncbi:hypothetical protein SAMN05878391_0567 [Salinicoccus kekensis]|uniref:Uncharacterized protein n=2 Tax=Salinicoccus kekensis TaxID=714307 RepID=A0A285UA89_9STAP|nr:hypothetical protein SAMN05878391_0567 [Salinicoccus kekensis]